MITDSAVTMDKKTKYTAGIMLLSLVPFVILQLANIFNTLYGSRVVVLIALIVSALSLLSYFIYQVIGGLYCILKVHVLLFEKVKEKNGPMCKHNRDQRVTCKMFL